MIKFFLTCIGLLVLTVSWNTVSARPSTGPPSVTLRTELSYVAVVYLESVDLQTGRSTLHFSLKEDLHNQSADSIAITVDTQTATYLEDDQTYIIAYQTHKRLRDGAQKKYLPLATGPELLQEQGAEPAIFRYSDALRTRLTSSPSMAVDSPELLVRELVNGLSYSDASTRYFFVREMINWWQLYDWFSEQAVSQLLTAATAPNARPESLTGFYENRPQLWQMAGIERLEDLAVQRLTYLPVELDPFSPLNTMVIYMLDFLGQQDKPIDNRLLERWIGCNNSNIAEKALKLLHSQDKDAAITVLILLQEQTQLSRTTRGMLERLKRTWKEAASL